MSAKTFLPQPVRQAATALACLLLFTAGSSTLSAQPKGRPYRPPTVYASFGKPDQAEGKAILQSFRSRGLSPYYFDFELQIKPRADDTRYIQGRMWGGNNHLGPITRVELNTDLPPAQQTRLLIQSGASAYIFMLKPGDEHPALVPASDILKPIIPDTDLTPFDLQMPFLFWIDFSYEGTVPYRGRTSYRFILYPPKEIADANPDFTGIRIYLDTQFNALLGAQQIGPEDRVLKTLTTENIRKIDNQYIVKNIDLRNEATRNKTGLLIKRAAVNLDHLPTLFTPKALLDQIPSPSKLTTIEN